MNQQRLRRRIFNWIVFFILALLLSGITAFPLEAEMNFLNNNKEIFPEFMQAWIERVFTGIHNTSAKYPFIMYGTDWLAYAHIAIALSFLGPLRDPVRNIWIIEWAILSCILVLPVAFIAGHIREIPFFHQMIDASFGLIGLIPLIIVHNDIRRLELLLNKPKHM